MSSVEGWNSEQSSSILPYHGMCKLTLSNYSWDWYGRLSRTDFIQQGMNHPKKTKVSMEVEVNPCAITSGQILNRE